MEDDVVFVVCINSAYLHGAITKIMFGDSEIIQESCPRV